MSLSKPNYPQYPLDWMRRFMSRFRPTVKPVICVKREYKPGDIVYFVNGLKMQIVRGLDAECYVRCKVYGANSKKEILIYQTNIRTASEFNDQGRKHYHRELADELERYVQPSGLDPKVFSFMLLYFGYLGQFTFDEILDKSRRDNHPVMREKLVEVPHIVMPFECEYYE